jgi:hypothetical protein
VPPEQVDRRRRTALEQDLVRHIRPGYDLGPWWQRDELAWLGKFPDGEVAANVGRTPEAVRAKRTRRGAPTACDRRRRSSPPGQPLLGLLLRRRREPAQLGQSRAADARAAADGPFDSFASRSASRSRSGVSRSCRPTSTRTTASGFGVTRSGRARPVRLDRASFEEAGRERSAEALGPTGSRRENAGRRVL